MKPRRGGFGVMGWLAGILAVAVLVAALPHVATAQANGHMLALGLSSVLPLGIGMIIIPFDPPLTRGQLDDLANPQFANQPEVVPWQLYDTQALTTASAAPLVFYQTIQADKTLSNMEGPGQLPDPQYMIVQYIAADILQPPTTTAITATTNNDGLANVANVLITNRATIEFNMSNKRYGPFSLSMCHATGGPTFNGYGVGTLAAAVSGGQVNNGIPGSGGYPFSGALVIPPKVGFDVTIRFAGALTIVGGPIQLRISLVGPLYRRVL